MNDKPDGMKKKPENGEWKKPVAWLLGRQMLASLKSIAMYAAFKGKLDPRDWMNPNIVSFTKTPVPTDGPQVTKVDWNGGDEFWFDYFSDSGDGQQAVYCLAYLCMSNLTVLGPPGWEDESPEKITEFIENSEIKVQYVEDGSQPSLPRGAFLFVGGDTCYHIADYQSLHTRFQTPFWWAWQDLETNVHVSRDNRPIIAIPGNHDYYDALDGFNRQFRAPVTGETTSASQRDPLLALPVFDRIQQASYVAIELPFDWWLFGVDTESGDVDFRQTQFFKTLQTGRNIDKLIVATSQPTTVFGKYATEKDALSIEFEALGLERPFLKEKQGSFPAEKIRLDVSGDVHHYARYWGPNSKKFSDSKKSAPNYASVVSGAGGAFFHPSHTDIRQVEAQTRYPSNVVSKRAVGREILNFWNLMKGGYIWLIGAIIGATIFLRFALGKTENEFAKDAQLIISFRELVSGGIVALLLSVAFMIASLIYTRSKLKQVYIEEDKNKKQSIPSILREMTPAIFLLMVAVISIILGERLIPPKVSPFVAAFIFIIALLWGIAAIVNSILYCEWLFKQKSYKREIEFKDYWPVWIFLALSVFYPAYALVKYGAETTGLTLLFDIFFIGLVLSVFLGLIALAIITGGQLHSWRGKFGFCFLGLWHAVLQLSIPLLFVWKGGLLAWVLAILLVELARRIGKPAVTKNSRKLLTFVWLAYGALMILLPFFIPGDGFFTLDGHNKAWLDECLPAHKPWVHIVAGSVLAAAAGMLWTCVWFGWYVAVALGYNGHNNEAGGAARIEDFKEFLRIRIRPEDITVYAIGFDKPSPKASELNLKIVDYFRLHR